MKVIIQRVLNATLTIADNKYSEIEKGLLIYVGVSHLDTESIVKAMSQKICSLKIFEDEKGHLGYSAIDKKAKIMIVSNFTIYANSKKSKLSFLDAAKPEIAKQLYEIFIESFKNEGISNVQTGKFGEYMLVTSTNDGPVNLILETD